MSALICLPHPFTVHSGSANALRPVSHLSRDQPGLVWRSNGLTGVFAVVQVDRAFDTIALIGSNLRSTDTIRFTAATTYAGLSSPIFDQTVQAWSGDRVDGSSAKTIVKMPSAIAAGFVRIDITAPGHQDGYVQAQRLVVGKSIIHEGIEDGCELGWIDQSPVQTGPNWMAFDEYPALAQWKLKTSWITDSDYRSKWANFLSSSGLKRAWLFVPILEDASRHQVEAVFGTTVTAVNPQHPSYDDWTVELTMRALAP